MFSLGMMMLSLGTDVACLTSVLLLVMCPGLVSLACFHLNPFQIGFNFLR